jgi:D-alanyl-D-alanine carboxypeptidase
LKKKAIITISLSVIAITIVSGVVFAKNSRADDTHSLGSNASPVSTSSSGSIIIGDSGINGDFTYIPPTLEDNSTTSNEVTNESDFDKAVNAFVPNTKMDLEPDSITVFVNKEYSIPKDYKPTDLVTPDVIFNLITYDERTLMRKEAADALEKLFAAAKEDDIILYGISGYRSYQRQYSIFTNNIVKQGKAHTLKYSAVPGTSEHQTGLSIDVSSKSLGFKLSSNFSSSPEGIWLAENAHRYGYIIRYPEDKADITGYAFEPWHIRYVGIGLANYLYTNEITLDEYYNYEPSPGFDFEALYADMINYVPPVVTVIPPEGEGVIIGENGEIIEGELEDGEIPDEAEEGDSGDLENGEEPEAPVTEAPEDSSDLPPVGEDPVEDPIPDESPDEQGQTDGEEDDTDSTEEDPDPVTEAPIEEGTSNEEAGSDSNTTDPIVNSTSNKTVNSNGIIHPDNIIE